MTRKRTATFLGIGLALSAFIWLLAGPLLRGPAHATEKTFDVGRANVDVVINPDASLRVTEHLRFRFSNEDFSGAYRDIALTDATRLSAFRIDDGSQPYASGGQTGLGSYDRPGTYGVTDLPDGAKRIVWHYEHSGGGHEDFNVAYTATGAAEAYDDVVYVHWAIWGDQWQFPLNQLEGQLRLAHPASGDGRPIKAWLTPAGLAETPGTTATGARVAVKRAPEGRQVVLSALYPRAAFSSVAGAHVVSGNGRAAVIADEDGEASSWLGSLANWVWQNVLWITAIDLLVVLLLIGWVLRRAHERPTSAPEYLPGPPEQLSPAVAYGIAREGEYSSRVVLATLLDLVDRGFYTSTTGTGMEDDDDGGKKRKKDDDRLDLVLAIAPNRGELDLSLEHHERKVLDFFDGLLGTRPGGLATLKDRIPKHSSHWRNKWSEMNTALRDASAGELQWDRDMRPVRFALAVLVPFDFFVLAVFTYARANEFYIPVIGGILATAFVLVPGGTALRRLAPAARDRQSQWASFARWTKDFPRLSDDPPATLLLWKRILVYAVAFGTAQRVIESGRIPEAVLAADPTWWGSTPGFYAGGGDFSQSFSSGFSSQVAAQSSSGGGGGGGGGGGSSGGGGGGAW